MKKIIMTATIDEEGKVIDQKVEVETITGTVADLKKYSRVYDHDCAGWIKNGEYNYKFLVYQQNWANDMLKRRGHIFLNEVYDMLGLSRTKLGTRAGWVYGAGEGIDFIYGSNINLNEVYNGDFSSCIGPILLEFNVMEDITDYL
jgi:hypothetical protein